jgi:hypothetical protein
MLKKIFEKTIWICAGITLTIIILFIFAKLQDKPRIGTYISNEADLKEIIDNLCKESVPFSISLTVEEKYQKEYKKIILPHGVSPYISEWRCSK